MGHSSHSSHSLLSVCVCVCCPTQVRARVFVCVYNKPYKQAVCVYVCVCVCRPLMQLYSLARGQLAVSMCDSEGSVMDVTGVQLQGGLDAHFAYDGPLGVFTHPETQQLTVAGTYVCVCVYTCVHAHTAAPSHASTKL